MHKVKSKKQSAPGNCFQERDSKHCATQENMQSNVTPLGSATAARGCVLTPAFDNAQSFPGIKIELFIVANVRHAHAEAVGM